MSRPRKLLMVEAEALDHYARAAKRSGENWDIANGATASRTRVTVSNSYRDLAVYSYKVDSRGRVYFTEIVR